MKRKNYLSRFLSAISAFLFMTVAAITANAEGGLSGSTVVSGTTSLLNDLMGAALIIAPILGGVAIVYFCIRRSMADEMDQKKWNGRIITAIVSTVGAVIAVSLLSLIIGYYQ